MHKVSMCLKNIYWNRMLVLLKDLWDKCKLMCVCVCVCVLCVLCGVDDLIEYQLLVWTDRIVGFKSW